MLKKQPHPFIMSTNILFGSNIVFVAPSNFFEIICDDIEINFTNIYNNMYG